MRDEPFTPTERFPKRTDVFWELSRLKRVADKAIAAGDQQTYHAKYQEIHALMRKYNIGEGGGMSPGDF